MRDLHLGEISEVFDEWAKEIKVPTRDIMFSMDRDKPNLIHIYTDIPGLMIGKAGCIIEKYKRKLNDLVDKHNALVDEINSNPDKECKLEYMPKVEINFVEVIRANFWLNYDPMSECF